MKVEAKLTVVLVLRSFATGARNRNREATKKTSTITSTITSTSTSTASLSTKKLPEVGHQLSAQNQPAKQLNNLKTKNSKLEPTDHGFAPGHFS